MSDSKPRASSDPGPSFHLARDGRALADEIRSYMARHREAMAKSIRAGFEPTRDPPGFAFSRAMDGLLSSLFVAAASRQSWRAQVTGLSMSAVGSYGRRSLAVQSDFDIRLLASDERQAQAIAEMLLYPLWDAGVTIGHQVVTIDKVVELGRQDLPTATSLLDWRSIAGDESLVAKLEERAFSTIFAPSKVHQFIEQLGERTRERIERYGGSVYLLEPDVRNGAGGLRDQDTIHWLARARWRALRPSELVCQGVLIDREWELIERAGRFLAHVRNLLHLTAGRRNDRLSFERQQQIAEEMGYGNDGDAVEHFMRDYYRHARALTQAREMMFLRARPVPQMRGSVRNLPNGLAFGHGMVGFHAAPEDEPVLVLRLYAEAIRLEATIHPEARARVIRLAAEPDFCERLRASEEAARTFVRLVTWVAACPTLGGSVLGELHDVGLLTAMIPEFVPVVGRVHHDIYHVYTVDVHSIKAVDKLRELWRGSLTEEFAVASHLAAELSRPTVLFLATLLHDVGKDIGGSNHSERGAELVETILLRLCVSPKDIREVQHLVRKHLVMYHVATRRDVEDPLTLEEFCREVHGHEGLRELFLLTLCDVATTSPDSLTSWKARVLDEFFLAADSFLNHDTVDTAEARENAYLEVLRRTDGPTEALRVKRFLAALPERYVLSNDPGRLMQEARFVFENSGRPAAVCALSLEPPYAEFAFLADDRPGLLAMIAATIASAHVEVVAAQVYSFVDEMGRTRALDLFWVHAPERVTTGKTLSLRFEQQLVGLLEGRQPTRALLEKLPSPQGRWQSRVTPAVTARVSFDTRGATRETIVEVIARDRPGLLFELANAIQEEGLHISLAKINTEGHQVADVFYVTEATGDKVTDPLRLGALEGRIRAAIG